MKRLIAFLLNIFILAAMASCSRITVTGDATDISYTSARLTAYANLPIEMGDAEFGVVYSTEPSPSCENGCMLEDQYLDADNMYSVVADELSSNTKYYYSSYVRSGRVYQYGKVKSFTTLEVKAEVKTEPATDVKEFSATLHGRISVENQSEIGMDLWFLYGTSHSDVDGLRENGRWASATLKNDGSFSSIVKELGYHKTYYYVACARVYDRYYVGEVGSFTTEDFELVAVDMGLSVKWANVNVGATKPEDKGDYYAWGETETKSDYSWETYKWRVYISPRRCNTFTKYCTENKFYWTGEGHLNENDEKGQPDKKYTLYGEDDVARARLGWEWHIPSYDDWKELRENCTWTWTYQHGVRGYLVTSKINGNSIFLPNVGHRGGTRYNCHGGYWSSSLIYDWHWNTHDSADKAVCITLDGVERDRVDIGRILRCEGLSVRPVHYI